MTGAVVSKPAALVRGWMGHRRRAWPALPRRGSLPRLVEVLSAASNAELELARTLARTLIGGMTAFSGIADAIAGRDNAAGFGVIRLLAGEPALPVVIVPLFIAILRSNELAAGLEQVLAGLQTDVLPVEQRFKELLDLPETERAERLNGLSRLSFAEQLRIKRLLVEFGGTPAK